MKQYLSINKINSKIKKNPQNAEALRERAVYLLQSGGVNVKLAKKEIDRAIALEPNAIINNRLLCFYYIEKGSYKTALRYAKKACKFEPENSTNFFFRGLCYKELGQFRKAINDLSLVDSKSPNYILALKNRADCHKRVNSLQEELDDLFKIISITCEYGMTESIGRQHWQALIKSLPPSAMLDFMKGYNCAQSDDEAINYYSSAIDKDDTQSVFFVFRGNAYLLRSEAEKALNDLNRAIELKDSGINYCLRARAFTQIGQYFSALNDWEKAIAIRPELEYYLGYAETCKSCAKSSDAAIDLIEKAQKYYKKVLQINPEHPLALFELADIYEQKGDLKRAKFFCKKAELYANEPEYFGIVNPEFLYEKLVQYYPNSEKYNEGLACFSVLNDDYVSAIACYTNLIRLNRTKIEYYTDIADIFMRQGLFQEAIQQLKTALEIQPFNIMLLKLSAICNMKQGNFETALDFVENLENFQESDFFLDASYCRYKLGDEFGSVVSLLKLPVGKIMTSKLDQPCDNIRFNFQYSSYKHIRIDGCEEDILDFILATLEDCSPGYLAAIISYLFMIQKIDVAVDKFISVAQMLSDNTVPEAVDQNELHILNSLTENYFEYEGSWNNVQKRDGTKLFNIRTKIALLDYLIKIAERGWGLDDQDKKHADNLYRNFQNIKRELIRLEKTELARLHEHELAESRIRERNKIIADLSHSIKNMISTIIDPLENLKNENTLQPQVLENALRGANLIREIVNAMNLSFKGSIEDFLYDAQHAYGSTAVSLQEMIRQSVIYSITNMFDGKYFNIFMRQYFKDKDLFISAKTAWENVNLSPDLQQLIPFLENYFFTCEFDIDLSGQLTIGNDKGSAIKLLILFQEIVLNAVKYCSFTPKSQRFIKIVLQESADNIVFMVENTFQYNIAAKTTGIGHILIDNFASLLNAKSKVIKDEEKYQIEISFPNLWKERS